MAGVPVYCLNSSNLGDKISVDIVRFLGLEARLASADEHKVVACGSIMSLARDGDAIWGTGAMYPTLWDDVPVPRLEVFAVRGPASCELLRRKGVTCSGVYGDPGMFLGDMYPVPLTGEYELGIIPHYVDAELISSLGMLKQYPAARVIGTGEPVKDFMVAVASCKCILSSSLHGIIAAESLGIPAGWIRLSDNIGGGNFKFHDYYMGSGRACLPHTDWRNPEFMPAPYFDKQGMRTALSAAAEYVNGG